MQLPRVGSLTTMVMLPGCEKFVIAVIISLLAAVYLVGISVGVMWTGKSGVRYAELVACRFRLQ